MATRNLSSNSTQLDFSLKYNARHHLSEIDQNAGSVFLPNSPYNKMAFEKNYYDGFNRLAEVFCPAPNPANKFFAPAFGVCGAAAAAYAASYSPGSCGGEIACGNQTWHQLFYDNSGRLLEEFESNGASAHGCASYDVTDHLYMGQLEVGRVLRAYQSPGGESKCAANSYKFIDEDILYLHHDGRGLVEAIESKKTGGLVWEAEIAPFGQIMNVGLPGPDGKLATAQPLITPTAGIAAGAVDGQLGIFLDQPGQLDPTGGRSSTPSANALSPSGLSTYLPTQYTSGPGGVATPNNTPGDAVDSLNSMATFANVTYGNGQPSPPGGGGLGGSPIGILMRMGLGEIYPLPGETYPIPVTTISKDQFAISAEGRKSANDFLSNTRDIAAFTAAVGRIISTKGSSEAIKAYGQELIFRSAVGLSLSLIAKYVITLLPSETTGRYGEPNVEPNYGQPMPPLGSSGSLTNSPQDAGSAPATSRF